MTKYKLISIDAAARMHGITWRTMKTLIDQGHVPAYRLGDLIRLDRAEVKEAMEKLHDNGRSKPVAAEPKRYVPKVMPAVVHTEADPGVTTAPKGDLRAEPASSWMDKHQLAEHFSISRDAFAHYRKQPGFPQPIAFSANVVRWNVAELEEWLRANSKKHMDLSKMRSEVAREAMQRKLEQS